MVPAPSTAARRTSIGFAAISTAGAGTVVLMRELHLRADHKTSRARSPRGYGSAVCAVKATGSARLLSRRSLPEQLKGMKPVVVEKAGDTPQHAQRLDGTSRLNGAHVCRLPAKLLIDFRHCLFGCVIVAADEHSWFSARELRVNHACVSHGVIRLDEMRIREFLLKHFHQRLGLRSEESKNSMFGRCIFDRIAGIHYGFAIEVLRPGQTQHLCCGISLHRQ